MNNKLFIVFEDSVDYIAQATIVQNFTQMGNDEFFLIESGEGDNFTNNMDAISKSPASDVVIVLDHDLGKAGNGETAIRGLLASLPKGSLVRRVVCTSSYNSQDENFQRAYVLAALEKYSSLCPDQDFTKVEIINKAKNDFPRELARQVNDLRRDWDIAEVTAETNSLNHQLR